MDDDLPFPCTLPIVTLNNDYIRQLVREIVLEELKKILEEIKNGNRNT